MQSGKRIIFRNIIMAYSNKDKQKAYFQAWYKNNKEYAHKIHREYYNTVGKEKKHRSYVLRQEFKRLCQILI